MVLEELVLDTYGSTAHSGPDGVYGSVDVDTAILHDGNPTFGELTGDRTPKSFDPRIRSSHSMKRGNWASMAPSPSSIQTSAGRTSSACSTRRPCCGRTASSSTPRTACVRSRRWRHIGRSRSTTCTTGADPRREHGGVSPDLHEPRGAQQDGDDEHVGGAGEDLPRDGVPGVPDRRALRGVPDATSRSSPRGTSCATTCAGCARSRCTGDPPVVRAGAGQSSVSGVGCSSPSRTRRA